MTARYDFSPQFALRGTISTGFRAPTLQEEYYSGTNVSTVSAIVQLPANSKASSDAGFGPLRPEQSSNYSVGFVAHPASRLQITADLYRINLRDRILASGFMLGSVGNYIVSQDVVNAIAARGITVDPGAEYAGVTLFTNAANTNTTGLDVTTTYASDFGGFGHVDWSLGFDFKQTDVSKAFALPQGVVNPLLGQTALLSPAALSALTTGTPQEKAILNGYWTLGRWSVNLRETIYGPASVMTSFSGTGSGAGARKLEVGTTPITDLDIGYKITPQLRLNIGANNLLNKKPPLVPALPNGSGGYAPGDGGNVYYDPALIAPYGINGGYYYGRITFSF